MPTNDDTLGYKFWMVYCIGNNAPKKSHSTKQQAQEEAQRLSAANPNQRFVVLEAVECYVSKAVVDMKVLESAPEVDKTVQQN